MLLGLCTAHSSTLDSSTAHSSTVDCSTAAHKGPHALPTAVCPHTAQMPIQHYVAESVALRTDTAVHTQPVHTQQIPTWGLFQQLISNYSHNQQCCCSYYTAYSAVKVYITKHTAYTAINIILTVTFQCCQPYHSLAVGLQPA